MILRFHMIQNLKTQRGESLRKLLLLFVLLLSDTIIPYRESPSSLSSPSLQHDKVIVHNTVPSVAIYTSVDETKEGSPEKREPDVVSPGSEGVSHCMNVEEFRLDEDS